MPLGFQLRSRRYGHVDTSPELRREAALSLLRLARLGVFFYPVAAGLLLAATRAPSDHIVEASLLGVATLLRLVVQFRLERWYERDLRGARRAQHAVTLGHAATWGLLAASILSLEGPSFAGLLGATASVALCSMALTVYASDLLLLDGYYACILGPSLLALIVRGDAVSISLAAAGAGFAAYCFLAAERLHADQWARLRGAHLLSQRADELERGMAERTARLQAASEELERERAELIHAEALLRLREEEYRRIFEGAHDAVLIFEPHGEVVLNVNQRACEIYGFTRQEFLGLSLREISVAPERGRQEIERTLRHGVYTHFETVQRRKDGSELRLEVNASVVEYRGHPAILSINRDLTERRRAEEMRLAKEAAERSARAKAEFLATVSHEIRTPLNGVLGLTSALLDGDLTPAQRELAENIRRSGDGLLAILNDILDFSRIDSGRLQLEEHPFELRAGVEECLDVVAASAAAKGLDLAYEMEPYTPEWLLGDLTRVRQVLVNLLGNAVKFTPHGEVVLTVGADVDPQGLLVRVAVRDTGIGIEPARLQHLFQPFSQGDMSMTRRFGGTGLGLVISRRLAERMGGNVWVESHPAAGSTFHFTFRARAAAAPAPAPPSLAGLRLLIVDDHAAGRAELARLTRAWGLEVQAVAEADEALACLRSRAWDVLLVDEDLPQDGSARLLAELPRLPGTPRGVRLAHPTARLADAQDAGREAAFVWRPARAAALRAVLERLRAPVPGEAPSAPVPAAGPAPLPSLRILLAEDNVVNQKVAQLMLKRLGQQADLAGDGVEALAALGQRDYDVVLMDVQMPEMDGLEATRRLRASLPPGRQPFVVALTANAMLEDRQRCLDAGVDDYLAKPVRLEELHARLRVAASCDRLGNAVWLDSRRLQQLRAEGRDDAAGEQGFVSAVLGVFVQGVPSQFATLRAARAEGDAGRLRRVAHAFRGSCAVVGAVRMASILEALEGAAEDDGRAPALLSDLDAAWERTRPLLEEAAVASPA